MKRLVVVRNTTSEPQEVMFTDPGRDQAGTMTSGPIPPGGTFELRPFGVVSITYALADRTASPMVYFAAVRRAPGPDLNPAHAATVRDLLSYLLSNEGTSVLTS